MSIPSGGGVSCMISLMTLYHDIPKYEMTVQGCLFCTSYHRTKFACDQLDVTWLIRKSEDLASTMATHSQSAGYPQWRMGMALRPPRRATRWHLLIAMSLTGPGRSDGEEDLRREGTQQKRGALPDAAGRLAGEMEGGPRKCRAAFQSGCVSKQQQHTLQNDDVGQDPRANCQTSPHPPPPTPI